MQLSFCEEIGAWSSLSRYVARYYFTPFYGNIYRIWSRPTSIRNDGRIRSSRVDKRARSLDDAPFYAT